MGIKSIIRKNSFDIIDYYLYTKHQALLSSFKSIGENCQISSNSFYGQSEKISIGNNVIINDYCHFWGLGEIEIGDITMIASHCAITTVSHSKASPTQKEKDIVQPIVIGKNVWIGAHVVILPGITIGDNAIIGAGAIVTKNIEANTVNVGMPAKQQL